MGTRPSRDGGRIDVKAVVKAKSRVEVWTKDRAEDRAEDKAEKSVEDDVTKGSISEVTFPALSSNEKGIGRVTAAGITSAVAAVAEALC
jgi:hypothetical protein